MNWINLYNESKRTQDNFTEGIKFEMRVGYFLRNPKTNRADEDARMCGREIMRKFEQENIPIVNVEVCGRQVSNQCGDIHIFYGPNKADYFVLEMKYVSKEDSGTWHNTSIDFLPTLFPDAGFITAKDTMNMPSSNTYDVVDGLQFNCRGKSFYSSLVALLEPLYSTHAVQNLVKPKNDYSPIKVPGITAKTLSQGTQRVSMFKDGTSVFAKFMDDESSTEVKLENPVFWKFSSKEPITVTPSILYSIQSKLANEWMITMKEDHFSILSEHPEILSIVYDNIFNKTMTKNGKKKQKGAPDFIVKFNKTNKRTTITDSQMFKREDENTIKLKDGTDMRFYIYSDDIIFPIQYRWKGGALMDNPAFHVEMPKFK